MHYLSGVDKDQTRLWDFYCTGGRTSGKWTKIPVPSCWEQQGFGTYNYGHDKEKGNEKGIYRHDFLAEHSWQSKRVFIVFEGSMTDTDVKVNGKSAGPVHRGGFYRFKYEISHLLKFGRKNLLEVTVSKMSSDESVNNAERKADYWVFGGIFRPVYLEIVPRHFIERIAIDGKADGTFTLDVYTSGTGNFSVEAAVHNLEGASITTYFPADSIATNYFRVRGSMDNASAWNAETPNLYELVVNLKKDQIIHSVRQGFGFRTVEVRTGDGIYVNGTKVMLKGVNRHSFWPESGRTLSKSISVLDAKLMKDMNMNAVRMSHYPPDKHFLEVCDSIGLYVIDELAGWQAKYSDEAGAKLVQELVTRDVNHPSVILWANGNEGGFNTNLDTLYSLYDPQKRKVIHPWEKFSGIDTKHYITYNYLVNFTLYGDDILLPTEFMHGLYDGGHAAGLDDYWNLMLRSPRCAGGFLWDFSDQGLVRTDSGGKIDTDLNHAADGILGPLREKEASFFGIKKIWSPVYLHEPQLGDDSRARWLVENRFDFTNLNRCSFTWKLLSFSQTHDSGSTRINAAGTIPLPSLLPQERGWVTVDLPNWKQSDAIAVTVVDANKNEICSWTWPIVSPDYIVENIQTSITTSLANTTDAGDSLIVSTRDVKFTFSKLTGQLLYVLNGGSRLSFAGPRIAGLNSVFEKLEYKNQNGKIIVQPVFQDKSLRVRWTLAADQPAKLDYDYSYKTESAAMGIVFDYPEEQITGLTWLGEGPYRVWKNRTLGNQFGLWHKSYNNTITGESWLYPEFKGYHANVYWATVHTRQMPFTIYTNDKNTFFQMLQSEKPRGAFNDHTSPYFPEGSIGILQTISPIGTKFQAPQLLGPQSQSNLGRTVQGTIWLDFRKKSY